MLRIFFVGVAIVAVFIVGKREHWLERGGVVGSCQLAQAPYRDRGQWWSCREGLVSGYPALADLGCDSQGYVARRELWRCPTPLEQVPGSF